MAGEIEHIRGKGFDAHPENINKKGRPKKIYTILKEKGYSADDIRTAFGEMAWHTVEELKKIHSDPKNPIITRIVANQFYLALSKNDWTKIKEILEHVIGRPTQRQEITGELPNKVILEIVDKNN